MTIAAIQLSRLLWLINFLFSSSGQQEEAQGFFFRGFDCSDPFDIKDVTWFPNPCSAPKVKVESSREAIIQILQRQPFEEAKGYVCRVWRSESAFYCGHYDHATPMPQRSFHLREIPVAVVDCQTMVTQKKFRLSPGEEMTVLIGGKSYHRYFVGGTVYYSGREVSCDGPALSHPQGVTDYVVISAEVVVEILEESFRGTTTMTSAVASRLELPCDLGRLSCRTDGGTFFWEKVESDCPGYKVAKRHVKGVFVQDSETWKRSSPLTNP